MMCILTCAFTLAAPLRRADRDDIDSLDPGMLGLMATRSLPSQVGERYGMLVVIAEIAVKGRPLMVDTYCDCDLNRGVRKPHRKRLDNLRSGRIKSCGCLRTVHDGDSNHDSPMYDRYRQWSDRVYRHLPLDHEWRTYAAFAASQFGQSWVAGRSLYRPKPASGWGPNNAEWAVPRAVTDAITAATKREVLDREARARAEKSEVARLAALDVERRTHFADPTVDQVLRWAWSLRSHNSKGEPTLYFPHNLSSHHTWGVHDFVMKHDDVDWTEFFEVRTFVERNGEERIHKETWWWNRGIENGSWVVLPARAEYCPLTTTVFDMVLA